MCGELMKKGDLVSYMEGKQPRYNDKDFQIGIEYYKFWMHKNSDKNCTWRP